MALLPAPAAPATSETQLARQKTQVTLCPFDRAVVAPLQTITHQFISRRRNDERAGVRRTHSPQGRLTRTLRETLLVQRVPAFIAPHERARARLLHVFVADRAVIVLARSTLLGGWFRRGGRGSFACNSRVRFAHARVREGVGRERGVLEDVLELRCEESSAQRAVKYGCERGRGGCVLLEPVPRCLRDLQYYSKYG